MNWWFFGAHLKNQLTSSLLPPHRQASSTSRGRGTLRCTPRACLHLLSKHQKSQQQQLTCKPRLLKLEERRSERASPAGVQSTLDAPGPSVKVKGSLRSPFCPGKRMIQCLLAQEQFWDSIEINGILSSLWRDTGTKLSSVRVSHIVTRKRFPPFKRTQLH